MPIHHGSEEMMKTLEVVKRIVRLSKLFRVKKVRLVGDEDCQDSEMLQHDVGAVNKGQTRLGSWEMKDPAQNQHTRDIIKLI
jgi:hypothetical protein